MKRKLGLVVLLLTLVVVCSGQVSAMDKYVIARVGAVDITVFELQRQTQRIMPFNTSFHGGVSEDRLKEIRNIAFERLVEQAYKVNYAQENGIDISGSLVDEKIKKVVAKFTDEAAFKKALRDESYNDFRSSVYRLLLSEKAEDVAVDSKTVIGDEELLTFYRANTFMYKKPREYKASHILVKVDPSLVGEEREKLVCKAEDLAKRAKAGENFYNLAYYNSDEDTKFVGGDIGYFHSGQTVREFEEAIKDIEPGDIVGPVETISGFHVIKLMDVREPRVMGFDEVKPKIKKTLEDKKHKQHYDEWLTALKSKYVVEILHPELQKAE